MPRASTEKKTVATKTTQTTKKVASKKVAKRSTKKVVSTVVATEKPVRKAPSNVEQSASGMSSFTKIFLGAVAVFILIAGASVAVGMSDSGTINVSEVITQRNSQVRDSGDTQAQQITVPKNTTTERAPNGGLRGKGKTDAPPAPPAETASSTEATASSSEPVASSTDQTTTDDPDAQQTSEPEVNASESEEDQNADVTVPEEDPAVIAN